MSSGMIEPRYQITIWSEPCRALLCWQTMTGLPISDLGVADMPRVDHETGQGYIVIDRYDRSVISDLVRSWLAALITLGLATAWSHERLEVDGDVTMLEVFSQP